MKLVGILTIFTAVSCFSQPNIDKLVTKLIESKLDTTIDFEKEFNKIGVQAIPKLIAVIDDNEKGFVGYDDPKSSNLSPLAYTFTGVRAAYMIEYILSGTGKKLFEKCRIGKIASSSEVTNHDMQMIKIHYSDWWLKNSSKSVEELNRQWKINNPLKQSNYAWY